MPRCTADVAVLDGLPAAVEVAAYAIAAEAVANAVRHSAGSRLRMSAAVSDGVLVVEVTDNGSGIAAPRGVGVGLRSMGERATEVSGRLDLFPADGGGTVVRAELPLRQLTTGGQT